MKESKYKVGDVLYRVDLFEKRIEQITVKNILYYKETDEYTYNFCGMFGGIYEDNLFYDYNNASEYLEKCKKEDKGIDKNKNNKLKRNFKYKATKKKRSNNKFYLVNKTKKRIESLQILGELSNKKRFAKCFEEKYAEYFEKKKKHKNKYTIAQSKPTREEILELYK